MRLEVPALKNGRRQERGVALFIAIFTLMLISVIATALILMAGTESAIKGNYKSSMQAFYDAKAGLEEGRSRLWAGNPASINACLGPAGTVMPVGRVCYIVNPDASSGETVNPLDLTPTNVYKDDEYQNEFGTPVTNAQLVLLATSTSPEPSANIAGPLYKWVRITPRTEASANLDVDGDGYINPTDPLFFGVDASGNAQQFIGTGNPVGSQVFTVTALAVTPNGNYSSRRMLQYTIASPTGQLALDQMAGAPAVTTPDQVLPSGLVMVGTNPWYEPASSNNFQINGNNGQGSNPGACTVPAPPALSAIGVTDDAGDVAANISNNRRNNYAGLGSNPSVSNVAGLLPPPEHTVTGLEAMVQNVTNAAGEVVTGPATSLRSYGTASNPVVAVVNGDLTLNGNMTGYGILLVTGKFTIGGNFGWRGIILVIGQGNLNADQSNGNEIDGAILVARTRDATGHPLASPTQPHVDWGQGTGNGIFYDSCWVNNALSAFPYQVLSFREISQLLP